MKVNKKHYKSISCALIVGGLAACQASPPPTLMQPIEYQEPRSEKPVQNPVLKEKPLAFDPSGVVVARTDTVANAGGVSAQLTSADCLGPAIGVNVENTAAGV